MDINMVVLNYNGLGLLKNYLASVVEAAAKSSHNVRVMLLDNCSTDASIDYVKREFPRVEIVVSKKNLVLISYNDFLKDIEEKVVILLNNDIRLSPNSIDYMVEHFKDPSVFFIAPRVMDIDANSVTGGCMDFYFKAGLYRNRLKGTDKNNYTLFIGGVGAFDREKFLVLGGYDPIYLPGTYEDVDICYRAWQRGWIGIYEPRALVFHEDSASFSKVYGNRKRQIISSRNAYIFVWKNIRDARILFESILFYPLLLIFNIIRLRFDLVTGSLSALYLLPQILIRRSKSKDKIIISDRQIKDIFQQSQQEGVRG